MNLNTIRKYANKRPLLFSGTLFASLSIILNTITILSSSKAYIYDIIHAMPIAVAYTPIIATMQGQVATEFIFLPLAALIDFAFGLLIAWFILKVLKRPYLSVFMLLLSFTLYWLIICYQWLPII